MRVPSLGWTLNGCPICQHSLVEVKDHTVFFVKSKQAVAGTEQIQNFCSNLEEALTALAAQPCPQPMMLLVQPYAAY